MEATFVLDAQEDRRQFAERLTSFFAGKTIRVRVEEVVESGVAQQHLLERMQSLRARTEQTLITLPPDLDINDIIDEVNDSPL